MALVETIDRSELIALLQSHFANLAREVDGGYLPTSDLPDFEIFEQRAMSAEHIRALEAQIDTNTYDISVQHRAAEIAGYANSATVPLTASQFADLCQGVARAEIEQLRLLLHRLKDRLSPYLPVDPLFASEAPMPTLTTLRSAQVTPLGPSLKTVVEHHLSTGRTKWTLKTYEGKRTKLGYLVEHIGPDMPIAAITADHVRSFKAAILRLRSNHRAGKAQSFAEKQTDNEKHRIAPETVLNIYNPARAFFAWATNVEGYLTTNPAANVRIEAPKRTKGVKSRRPFTGPELEKLFNAPVFTGCASPQRRFVPGPVKIKDDRFWIPILALYTGARLGELVQLHLRDVVIDGPVPYIDICETVDKPGTGQPKKHVKSEAGIRKIPIHPDVMELGFAEFVVRQRKLKRSPRLFHAVKFGADQQASTTFSKFFARVLDKQGLKDPALTFHSLRHGMQDALRDARQPQYIIDRLFGHSSGTTAEQYGTGASLEVLYEAVKLARLKVSLPIVLDKIENASVQLTTSS